VLCRDSNLQYSAEEVKAAFSTFMRQAPEGHIRFSDLREALTVYLPKEINPNEVYQTLKHFQDGLKTFPNSKHEYFQFQDYIDLMMPTKKEVTAVKDETNVPNFKQVIRQSRIETGDFEAIRHQRKKSNRE
jgi:hypothetical protein